MISIMLLDIFAGAYVYSLFEKKDIFYRFTAVLLTICLTASGFFEFYIVSRKNVDDRAMTYPYEDDIMEWIWDNTDENDIILSANYYLMYGGYANSVILSGHKMYSGWDYFSWSAGYDVGSRNEMIEQIYSAQSTEELYELIDRTEIDYIVVDRVNRDSETYILNENTIRNAFRMVFTKDSGPDRFSIYDVSQRLK